MFIPESEWFGSSHTGVRVGVFTRKPGGTATSIEKTRLQDTPAREMASWDVKTRMLAKSERI